MPQFIMSRVLQVEAVQQPVAHETELHVPPLHMPPEQVAPAAHAGVLPQRQAPADEQLSAPLHVTHVAPLVPHAVTLGVVQTFPTQHPLGHEVESQTHPVPTHR